MSFEPGPDTRDRCRSYSSPETRHIYPIRGNFSAGFKVATISLETPDWNIDSNIQQEFTQISRRRLHPTMMQRRRSHSGIRSARKSCFDSRCISCEYFSEASPSSFVPPSSSHLLRNGRSLIRDKQILRLRPFSSQPFLHFVCPRDLVILP